MFHTKMHMFQATIISIYIFSQIEQKPIKQNNSMKKRALSHRN